SSVAVVGVGRGRTSVGRAVHRHIQEAGFAGSLYAVNPAAEEADGTPLLPSVTAAPGPVDLAIVAVPPEEVVQVVREAAGAGAAAVVVVSSGFAEAGSQGVRRQGELLRAARDAGMRVLGPNSFGFINTDPEVRLNASLSPRMPAQGSFGLFAQSGALGIA